MTPHTFTNYLESDFLFNIEFGFQYDKSLPINELISDTTKIVKNYIGTPGYKNESKYELGYGSNNFTFSELNIKKCIQLLNHLKQYYSKNKVICKYFNINYNFPLSDDWSFYWLICHLALDKNMIKTVSKLTIQNSFFNGGSLIMYNGNTIDLDVYLNDVLMKIRNSIINEDYRNLYFSLIRLPKHYKKVYEFFLPQKSGHWEGPNDFLDNIDIIKSMLIDMNTIANWMAKISKSNELNGLSKENFHNIFLDIQYNKK